MLRDPQGIIRIHYKDMLYALLRWPAFVASFRQRLTNSWKQRWAELRVNLGPGPNYLEGWINIDIVPTYRKDVWLDIRDRWPLKDNEVAIVYAHHVFEHFDLIDLMRVLKEARRVLKPDGLLRFGVPSLSIAIDAYVTDNFVGLSPISHQSRSKGRKFNDLILYHSQHKLAFDFGFAQEILLEAGYEQIVQQESQQSSMLSEAELALSEKEFYRSFTLYVEARPSVRVS